MVKKELSFPAYIILKIVLLSKGIMAFKSNLLNPTIKVNANLCAGCSKNVYKAEEILAIGLVWHKDW